MTTDEPQLPPGKSVTRRTVAAKRDAMTPEARAEASAAIARHVDAWLATRTFGPLKIFGLYAGKGSEVDTLAIDQVARARGFRVAYPRMVPGQGALDFHIATPDELIAGKFGVREPHADAPPCPLSALSVIVIPGLAFDRAGNRLGWGKGHYDSTLPHASTLKLGVAFDCQLIERVPLDAHDVPLDIIITETATHVVAAAEVTP